MTDDLAATIVRALEDAGLYEPSADLVDTLGVYIEDDILTPLRAKIEILREDNQAFRAQWQDDVAALQEANRQLCDQAREAKRSL